MSGLPTTSLTGLPYVGSRKKAPSAQNIREHPHQVIQNQWFQVNRRGYNGKTFEWNKSRKNTESISIVYELRLQKSRIDALNP